MIERGEGMDTKESCKLAGKHYDPSMRGKENQDHLTKGLSLTHEQVIDNYMEGTIDHYVKKQEGNK